VRKFYIIPPSKTRYLSEISENNRSYDKRLNAQAEVAQKLYGIKKQLKRSQKAKWMIKIV
jgi:methylmalonyl-CoA mutase